MRPRPPSPVGASPQVRRRMADERFTASMGPTPSTTTTGTTSTSPHPRQNLPGFEQVAEEASFSVEQRMQHVEYKPDGGGHE